MTSVETALRLSDELLTPALTTYVEKSGVEIPEACARFHGRLERILSGSMNFSSFLARYKQEELPTFLDNPLFLNLIKILHKELGSSPYGVLNSDLIAALSKRCKKTIPRNSFHVHRSRLSDLLQGSPFAVVSLARERTRMELLPKGEAFTEPEALLSWFHGEFSACSERAVVPVEEQLSALANEVDFDAFLARHGQVDLPDRLPLNHLNLLKLLFAHPRGILTGDLIEKFKPHFLFKRCFVNGEPVLEERHFRIILTRLDVALEGTPFVIPCFKGKRRLSLIQGGALNPIEASK